LSIDSTASSKSRLSELRENPRAKVLVIGGGINGIATFRDLALQGVDVALVERGDFSAGASAASSHMIHGGVRYLENGEFRLVKESLQERNRLLSNAPHCVKPLPTTIPIFSFFSGVLSAPLRFLTHKSGKPKERGALLIKVGLMLYDTFGRDGGTMPRHTFWGKKKTLKNFPDMNKNVKYSATYFDASMESPERLSLEVLGDALSHENARAANYCSVTGANGKSISLKDELTGESFNFEADLVINCTGPWTDLTNELMGSNTSYMGGTKGSHIVVDHPELLKACDGREIFFENDDGRIVLMYPLMGRVLIGTTDIPVDMREPVFCTEEEVDYFIELVKLVFPQIEVSRDQIVFRYSGVRPLPAADDVNPGFVSRDYSIELTEEADSNRFALLSLVGGKWTTFRALGEHLTDEALKLLGTQRKQNTRQMPIGGGKNFPKTEAEVSEWISRHAAGVDKNRAKQLLNRYGTKAEKFIAQISDQGETPLKNAPDYSDVEIRELIHSESATSVSDIIHRRTVIGFRGGFNDELLKEIGEIVSKELGLSKKELEQQQSRVRAEMSGAQQ